MVASAAGIYRNMSQGMQDSERTHDVKNVVPKNSFFQAASNSQLEKCMCFFVANIPSQTWYSKDEKRPSTSAQALLLEELCC